MSAITDKFLRQYGFTIAERPKVGKTKWRDQRTHYLCDEDDALMIARGRQKEDQEGMDKAPPAETPPKTTPSPNRSRR